MHALVYLPVYVKGAQDSQHGFTNVAFMAVFSLFSSAVAVFSAIATVFP